MRKTNFVFLVSLLTFSPLWGVDLKEGQVIRDVESEEIIHDFTSPLLEAAGLPPSDLQIVLIHNPQINAATGAGMTLFIHTGLIQKTKNIEELIGVLAHEVGHMAGGHILRMEEAYQNALSAGLLSAVLGGLAAVLSGNAEVAMGGLGGAGAVIGRSFSHFTRTQESAADQGALRLLKVLGWPAWGLRDLLKTLGEKELLSEQYQDLYMRTHPLSRERIEFLEDKVTMEGHLPSGFAQRFKRLQGKINAYMLPAGRITLKYREATSPEDQYAYAIGLYRQNEKDQALKILKGLSSKFPQDPYFWELRGEILFDTGDLPAALEAYRKTNTLKPHVELYELVLAKVMVEIATAPLLKEASEILLRLTTEDKDDPAPWYFLSLAQGKAGDEGSAALSLAEYYTRLGDTKKATEQAKRVMQKTPPATPRYRRAQDIESLSKEKNSETPF